MPSASLLALEDPDVKMSSGGLSKRLSSAFDFLLLVGLLVNKSSSRGAAVVFLVAAGLDDDGGGFEEDENKSLSPNRSAKKVRMLL